MQVHAAHKLSPQNIFFDKKALCIYYTNYSQEQKGVIYLILHTLTPPSSYTLAPPRICRVYILHVGRDAILPLDKTRDVNYSCRQQRQTSWLVGVYLQRRSHFRKLDKQGFKVFKFFILTSFQNILCGDTGEINHYGTAATEPKQLQSASGEKRIATISPEC